MPFELKNVVPWGRSFAEYQAMFALSPQDLQGRILGCGDGPASFNAEATAQGYTILSCDPIYAFSPQAIETRVQETYSIILEQTRQNQAQFVWTHFQTPERLGAVRLTAMRAFIADFAEHPERYIAASLPELPFPSQSFDLALCSHFLFLYSEQFNFDFHLAAVLELCRIAKEVRIFPLHNLANQFSPYVEPVLEAVTARGYQAELVTVQHEFQRGATQMLCIHKI